MCWSLDFLRSIYQRIIKQAKLVYTRDAAIKAQSHPVYISYIFVEIKPLLINKLRINIWKAAGVPQ